MLYEDKAKGKTSKKTLTLVEKKSRLHRLNKNEY